MSQGRRKRTPRWHKAVALLPLVALSGAWSADAASDSTARPRTEPVSGQGQLATPAVPDEIFDQPASVALPKDFSAPTGGLPQLGDGESPGGGSLTTAVNGIPNAALYAYQRAAAILDAADPGCNLDWTLLAAIGRVESDHGRIGGNVIGDDGVARPGIYGLPLDGSGGTARITDTDGGALDDDSVYDRAVGPMQFIPGTWSLVGVDADEDGSTNPQDIEDAATAAGVYLCAGSGDLSNDADRRAAVLRYNHSRAYADHVLAIAAAYSNGNYAAVPNGTPSSTTLTPADPQQQSSKASAQRKARPAGAQGSQGGTAQAPPADNDGGRSAGSQSSSADDDRSSGDGDDTSPEPSPSSSPTKSPSVEKTAKQVEERAKKTVDKTTETVEKTIGLAKATALCEDKLEPALGLPLLSGLTRADIDRCGEMLADETLARAEQQLSGTVRDVLARLGL